MKTKIVSYTLETLPPLTKAQLANLKAAGDATRQRDRYQRCRPS